MSATTNGGTLLVIGLFCVIVGVMLAAIVDLWGITNSANLLSHGRKRQPLPSSSSPPTQAAHPMSTDQHNSNRAAAYRVVAITVGCILLLAAVMTAMHRTCKAALTRAKTPADTVLVISANSRCASHVR